MVIPAGAAQVNLIFSGLGLPTGAQVTYGISVALSPLDPGEVAVEVLENYTTANFMNLQSTAVNLTGILVKFGPNETGPSALLGTSRPGLNADPASPAVAYLAHKRTALGGRRGRGRSFWPGCRESVLGADGSVSAVTVEAYNTALQTFLTKHEADGLDVLLLHGDATAPTPVTSWVLDSKAATQRRRQRR